MFGTTLKITDTDEVYGEELDEIGALLKKVGCKDVKVTEYTVTANSFNVYWFTRVMERILFNITTQDAGTPGEMKRASVAEAELVEERAAEVEVALKEAIDGLGPQVDPTGLCFKALEVQKVLRNMNWENSVYDP